MDYQELPKNFKFNEGQANSPKPPMTPDEYQALAARTDKDRTEQVLTKLKERPDAVTLLHSVIGMVGELGEICADLQDWLFYNKPLNEANLLIEYGDIPWYHAQGVRALHTKLSTVLEANLAKLRKRFPEKYTDECAAEENRDRVAENEAVAAVVEASAPKPTPVCIKENDQGKCHGFNHVHNCPVVDPRYRDQPTAVEVVGRRHGADPDRFGEADAPKQQTGQGWSEPPVTLAEEAGSIGKLIGYGEAVLEPADSDLSKHFNEEAAAPVTNELMDEAVKQGWAWHTSKDGKSYFVHSRFLEAKPVWVATVHRGVQGMVPANLAEAMSNLGQVVEERSAAKLPPDVAIGFALAWEIVRNFVDGTDARKAAIRRIQALELSTAKNLELEGGDLARDE